MKRNETSCVQALLHDTNDAFLSCGGGMNTDYAEFAGMALSDFRTVLRRPHLKRKELVAMLRKGMRVSHYQDKSIWAVAMENQLKNAANLNAYVKAFKEKP
jgi:hypothetical protein